MASWILYILHMQSNKSRQVHLKTAFDIYSRNARLRARAARNDFSALELCRLDEFGRATDAVRQLIVTAADCNALSGKGCLGAAVKAAVLYGWISRVTADKWMRLFFIQNYNPPMYAILHAFRMLGIKGEPPDPFLLVDDIVDWAEGNGDSVAKRWAMAFYSSRHERKS